MARPIDRIRNSAIQATLPPDVGGIQEMCEINSDLHLIGRTAIYRVRLADQIDPQRTNIAVPDTHQRVLPYGTDFLFARQTLMQTLRFVMPNVLGPNFDRAAAISQAFQALHDFAAMHEDGQEILARQQKVAGELEKLVAEGRNLTIPTIGNDVRMMTLNFLHRANHCANTLYNIAKIFYGGTLPKGMWDGLHGYALKQLGADDPFSNFLAAILPFMNFIRNARNAMEHPKPGYQADFSDFTLAPDTMLNPPTFTLQHPETPQPAIPVLDFMQSIMSQLGNVFEIMLAHLAGVHVQPFAGLPLGVMEYDEGMQQAYKCRYGYCSRIGDRDIPFG